MCTICLTVILTVLFVKYFTVLCNSLDLVWKNRSLSWSWLAECLVLGLDKQVDMYNIWFRAWTREISICSFRKYETFPSTTIIICDAGEFIRNYLSSSWWLPCCSSTLWWPKQLPVCVCGHLTSVYLEIEYWDGRSQIKVHTIERTHAGTQRPVFPGGYPSKY